MIDVIKYKKTKYLMNENNRTYKKLRSHHFLPEQSWKQHDQKQIITPGNAELTHPADI